MRKTTWDVSRRTSTDPAFDPRHQPHPARRGQCDSAHPASLSHDRLALRQWSVLEGCARLLECRSSLPCRSSNAHAQLFATPSSASWAWTYRHGDRPLASEDKTSAPGSWSSHAPVGALF